MSVKNTITHTKDPNVIKSDNSTKITPTIISEKFKIPSNNISPLIHKHCIFLLEICNCEFYNL
jgi:hypothetical protein